MLLLEDRDLLESYRAGDPEALGRVFDHYYGLVAEIAARGFSFPTGGRMARFSGYRSSADVFDVVHEVFRAAFEPKARLAYGGLRPFGGYLATIARNLILSRLRHDQVMPVTEPLETADQLSDPAPSPEENVSSAEERAVVAAFLETISDEERRFTELRFLEDQAQEEVAEALGVGRKKVRLLEIRVRTKLQLFLKQRGMTPCQHKAKPYIGSAA